MSALGALRLGLMYSVRCIESVVTLSNQECLRVTLSIVEFTVFHALSVAASSWRFTKYLCGVLG
jgi:hypothetical protein